MGDYDGYLRPVEFASSAPDLTLDYGGGHTHAISLTSGVYCNVYSLAQNISKKAAALTHTVTVTVETTMGMKIVATGATVTWNTPTNLRDTLGFSGASFTNSDTASLLPKYTWFPLYVRSDQNTWVSDYDGEFAGQESTAGNVYGLGCDRNVYYLAVSYPHERVAGVFEASNATQLAKVKCLENFVRNARRKVWPDAVGNPSPAGFYYWPDRTKITDLMASQAMTGATGGNYGGDAGSASGYDSSDNARSYVFCHFDTDKSFPSPGASLQRGISRFNVSLNFHTATPPTWATSVVS